MALQNYTNRTGTLTSTNATTVYTVPDGKTAIIQGGNIMNASASTPTLDIDFTNASDTDFKFVSDNAFTGGQFKSIIPRPCFLDEKEKIKLTASAANKFDYHFSFAEVDQGVNNKYINKMVDMDSTNKTTIYTVPDNRTAIITQWAVCNYTDSNVGATNYWYHYNADGDEFELAYGTIAADSSVVAFIRSMILQEKEAIKFQAQSADALNVFASILEMERAGGSASE